MTDATKTPVKKPKRFDLKISGEGCSYSVFSENKEQRHTVVVTQNGIVLLDVAQSNGHVVYAAKYKEDSVLSFLEFAENVGDFLKTNSGLSVEKNEANQLIDKTRAKFGLSSVDLVTPDKKFVPNIQYFEGERGNKNPNYIWHDEVYTKTTESTFLTQNFGKGLNLDFLTTLKIA